jgi:hypothetical protein
LFYGFDIKVEGRAKAAVGFESTSKPEGLAFPPRVPETIVSAPAPGGLPAARLPPKDVRFAPWPTQTSWQPRDLRKAGILQDPDVKHCATSSIASANYNEMRTDFTIRRTGAVITNNSDEIRPILTRSFMVSPHDPVATRNTEVLVPHTSTICLRLSNTHVRS